MPLFLSSTTTSSPSLHFLNQHSKSPRLFGHNRSSLCLAMSMESDFDLKGYWTSLRVEINKKLGEVIGIRYPERLNESMRYSVLAPGAKRAAPVMCIASCELFGGSREAAFPTACALEMVHEASLIHHDLPNMADDIFRRGRPSNHAIYGVDMAILAGDALFPLGYQHIVSHTPLGMVPEAALVRVIIEMARTVGSTGMAAGEFVDLTNGEDWVEFVQEKKFGELSKCSAVCGGILGGATDDEVDKMGRYGQTVGVLYQVVEDILEEKKRAEEEEKNKGRSSFAKSFGVERAMEKAEMLRVKAKNELDGLEKYGEWLQPLLSFVDYAVDRSFTLEDV